ncbi:MAG: 16S rRNA (uracil(1498)-N(3))-methyltransferase [Rickettsiales bacterium]|jgi:16S rRNA (uracil1498-N3)-methyltransferase|nr:16S rRNA (uracil(1498)-N(3))-methyltransferase [Rickettsiales bacterium]
MTYIRIYLNSAIIENSNLVIAGDDFFYLKNVMRIKAGKIIKIFNERDGEFFAVVKEAGKREIILEASEKIRDIKSEKLDIIHLFVSPLRQSRMSWLVEKCVELGVKEITPVRMQNTAFDMDFAKAELIIKEATEQCERLSKLKINPVIKLDEFLDLKIDFIYLKERDEKSKTLKEVDKQNIKNIMVGPEGGFDKQELEKLESSIGIPVWLGQLILRAETAAIKAISVLSDV